MNPTAGTGTRANPPHPLGRAYRFRLWGWQFIAPVAAAALIGAGVLLAVREFGSHGDPAPATVAIAPDHVSTLNENIRFWEQRAAEIQDHLSYNRLTGLYLQRLRETGDTSDVVRAEIAATKSLEVFPGGYSGMVNLALVRVAQHDFAGALELAEAALVAEPDFADAYAVAGDAEMALGRYDEAGESYRKVLELSPGFDAFVRQAAFAEVQGKVEVAKQYWQAAIRNAMDAPENAAWARVQYGTLLATVGDRDVARAEFTAALETYPGFASAHAGLGRVAAMEGDDAEAIRQYTFATERIPLPDYVIALGELYQRAGDVDAAERQFALVGAMKQLLESHGVRNELPLIQFALDHGTDYEMALADAEIAFAERPSIVAADTLAWAYYRNGRFEDARRSSQEALRTGAVDPVLHYHAGMIAAALGDTAEARLQLERAIAINPEFSITQSQVARETLAGLKGGAR